MSPRKIANTAKLLLLLYVGYFGSVSLFIHSHIYNGVLYVHSHPFQDKDSDEAGNQTHQHNSATLFGLNSFSNLISETANSIDFHCAPFRYFHIARKQYIENFVPIPFINANLLRAPPTSFLF